MQQTQASRATVDPRPSDEFRSLVDPKVLEKLPNSSGKESDFLDWETVFSSVVALIGVDGEMKTAAESVEEERANCTT